MNKEFEKKVNAAVARNHWNPPKWVKMADGSYRAVIPTNSWDEFFAVEKVARRLKNVKVETWYASSRYVFEGKVYLYDQKDYEALQAFNRARMAEANAWCLRYHNALVAGYTESEASRIASEAS